MVTSNYRLRARPGPSPVYTSNDIDEDRFVRKQDKTTEHVEEDCPLKEIDKILDREFRPTASNDPDSDNGEPSQVMVKQYLVKWKGLSYLHCSWVSEQEFEEAYKSHPLLRLKTRVNKFNAKMDYTISLNGDDYIAIRPEWTTVDRIIDCRGEDDEKEYLVKFKELDYNESYWEAESDISMFQSEIQRFKDINSGSRRAKYVQNERKQKEFKHFDHTPEFLTGSLHTYQLEGLNFLQHSWYNGTHVMLANEMGLGKTIQCIAFLASLFEENKAPHLVVAPLTTLRNWEREFATWAPHINVVMYTGPYEARKVIREHEFYFPKGKKIKFDVLLTSYEYILIDTAVLKPIKWICMIVDEGHRLKNQTSKLFTSLKQFKSKHRVLLTGTPLQNNLDELFVLMHFLDGEKFRSLEEFQEEFEDINQEEQISRLHQILAPHLLRRVKNDVLKNMLPPKKELILRVDLSSQQKHFYKAMITRNYQILAKKRGGNISNVLMELRKVCSHPYLLDGTEPKFEDANEALKQLLEASGKLQLLDKMMVKLKEQGHRVLIYTQFQHTLDLFQDYCSYKNWFYERLDGKVVGPERQVRIDRFNAENSNRFCFLLSTRAGGIGINLATADTVIIYDSDWNPHADLQAMARAHRLGQTNKVMIYRLIHRGTVEERMMDMTKKKMLLEHLVVGKMKKSKLSQDELDDLIKHGSKELFSEENDEAGKSGKIHYDDAAIDKLLDRDYIDDEEVSKDGDEENGFLKAFKVANFEYIDEKDAVGLEESHRVAAALEEAQAIENNSDRTSYWKELLKDEHEVHQAEELNVLGKRKRTCKQGTYVEEDDDDVEDDDVVGTEMSSDEKEEAVEAKPTVVEAAPQRNPRGRKPYCKRRARDNSKPAPLMEGEGTSLRVLGFNRMERNTFLSTFKRYGAGNFDWKEFVQPLKHKTFDEINKYGIYFLQHIVEKCNNNSSTFSDGVPKEEIYSNELQIRMTFMILVKEKCQFLDDHPTEPVFPDHIIRMYSLRSGPLSEEEYDRVIIRGISKHGYGRWMTIVNDKELGVQELFFKNVDDKESGAEQVDLPESSLNQETGNKGNKNAKQSELSLKTLGELVGRRVRKLEIAIKYEYTEKVHAEQAEAETKVMDTVGASSVAADKEMLDQLPQSEPIISQEVSGAAVDNKQDRVEEVQLYNLQSVSENSEESVQTYSNLQPLSPTLRESFSSLEPISEEISRILSAGTDHNVEMMDLVQEPTSRSNELVVPSIVEEDDVKMDAADNFLIVLD